MISSTQLKFTTPWLASAAFDLVWLILPGLWSILIAVALAQVFPEYFHGDSPMPLVFWFVCIVGIDVSHVYSTLYRTYLDREVREQSPWLLGLTPVLIWICGVFLYSISSLSFWRVLAYVAVFHFIRQQYGFMRLYDRHRANNPSFRLSRRWDELTVWAVTLFPILYWHAHLPQGFSWFVPGDFIAGLPTQVSLLAGGITLVIVLGYIIKELASLSREGLNVAKNLLLLSTALSWTVGIVFPHRIAANSDLVFTLTNVITHGVPYLALIWWKGFQDQPPGMPLTPLVFRWTGVPLFLTFLIGLSYLEEGLWDGLVWREHLMAFPGFDQLPAVSAPDTLVWLVPLLALPQATHYVLDGFIWKQSPLQRKV